MKSAGFALISILSSWIVVSAASAASATSAEKPSNPKLFGGVESPGWLSTVERSLAEKEYEASANRSGLQAPNRRQDFRTYFEAGGIRLVDRTAQGSPELVRLRVASIGRGGKQEALAPGTVTASGRQVEIARPGRTDGRDGIDVAEHFENSPEGLRQTLTIARRPAGGGDLEIVFEVGTAIVERAPEGVAFLTPNGRRLAMKRLPATDSAGKLLASRLVAAGDSRVRFTVEEQAAAYPLTVEFLFTGSAAATLQGDQASAEFGISVAGAGDVNGDGYGDVLVGAFLYDSGEADEGAAFVFLGSAAGIASGGPAGAATTLQGNQASALFGTSVAAAGDVNGDGYGDVLVGAPAYDSGELNEGAAFVFLGSASGIVSGGPSSAAATLQSNQAGASFGVSVAGAGDVNGDGYADVLVGARLYDGNDVDEGAAFVFLGSASGIASGDPGTAAATLAGKQAGASFGVSVAGAGDVNGDGYADVIVGAYLYDSPEVDEGAAFVFQGSASGIVSGGPAGAATTLQGNQAGALFGTSVAGAVDVNGDGYADVLVGAPQYDSGETDEGAAFVFRGSAAGVESGGPATAAATLQSNQTAAELGISVAGAGDVNGDGYADVLVGAHLYKSPEAEEGATFVFLGSASGITSGGPASAAATLQSDQPGAQLGVSVAGAGDVNGDGYADVVVGAFLFDSPDLDEGAAFVFLGGASGIASGGPSNAAATLQGNQSFDAFGLSVAGAGDVNGDGFADVIVGAPQWDSGETQEGAAFVFLGSESGIGNGGPSSAAATLQGNQASAAFGRSVAGAGDVNGDGYADVVVGALQYDSGEVDEGAAFVFLGSASGIASGGPSSAAAILQGNQAGAEFGFSVAGAGDVNGDGYADVLVGADAYDSGETDEGAAFVFLGSPAGIASGGPSSAAATLQGNQASAIFGISVAGAGDVNGDGYADIVVGAFRYASGEAGEGAAFVFLGSASGIASGGPSSAAATLQGNQVGAELGDSVAGAGDVNGDGYADVIVGAHFYDSGEADEGAAFVFLGSASGIASGGPSSAAATLQGNQASAEFGWTVAGAGDVNGDGYADVLVAAYRYASPDADEGAAFVFLGSASGIASGGSASASATLQGNLPSAFLGWGAAGAGDVNGDGYADVVVGAPGYGSLFEGQAFVFLGNGATGRHVLARQFRAGSPVPVEPWGGSLGSDSFDARMACYHPAGGGRVKLEVEACPAGRDFGMTGCVTALSSAWADVTATATLMLSESVPGLTASRLYHWRARTLYAPVSVTAAGITAPPKPAHGPWRRLSGQAVEADIRTAGGFFYALVPCRVVDTRPGSGAPIGGPVLTSGVERSLPLVNKCNIPLTARAVSVNLTAVGPTGPGFLVLYPVSGAPTPTSNLNFNGGVTRANNSILGLNRLGQMQVIATVNNPAGADEVHFVLDVNGYFE